MRMSDWSSDVCSSDLWVEPREADVLISLGGDGFMLQTLHAMMAKRRTLPVFGMNLGTVGFLMNEYRPEALAERIGEARRISFHPLSMEVRTLAGSTVASSAINEVSPLRATTFGSAHVWTPVTNAHLVCRLLLYKNTHRTAHELFAL